MQDCVFCKIAEKQLPSTVVYEDDKVMAFNDIRPVAPVHVIIIPKAHVENASMMGDIHLAAKKVAEKLGDADKGYRLINNCGADAGQTVFHLHYHLVAGVKLGAKII